MLVAKSISDFKSSVAENEGYYIGRYEARTVTERKDAPDFLTQVTTKGNEYVYNWITQKQAIEQSRNMYTSVLFTSDLINSYSWDTAILYLQECGTNSDYSQKTTVNDSLSPKGTNNQEIKDIECNVYDMASNLREWSTETSNNLNYPCTNRGGVYDCITLSAKFRYYTATYYSFKNSSFRPILYVN